MGVPFSELLPLLPVCLQLRQLLLISKDIKREQEQELLFKNGFYAVGLYLHGRHPIGDTPAGGIDLDGEFIRGIPGMPQIQHR